MRVRPILLMNAIVFAYVVSMVMWLASIVIWG